MQLSLAGRLPNGKACSLSCDHDAIAMVPYARWDLEASYITKNQMRTRFGSFLEDIDLFDGIYFGISLLEAELMDPQQRLLLEVQSHNIIAYHMNIGECQRPVYIIYLFHFHIRVDLLWCTQEKIPC